MDHPGPDGRGRWLRWALPIVCLLLAVTPAPAHACGLLFLQTTNTIDWQGATGNYDVFDANTYVQAVEIRVVKLFFGTCSYAIGISEGGSGSFNPRELSVGQRVLDYNLYDSPGQTNVVEDASSGGTLLVGQFTNNAAFLESNVHTYYWVIPPLQIVSGTNGQYQDRPSVTLYENVGGTLATRDTASIRHRTRAPRAAEISLVDTGAPFDAGDLSQSLNFGIFFTGESLSFDLLARANTNFDLSLQSANAGRMAHTSLASAVPYTLTVDGAAVDLTGGGPVQIASFGGSQTSVQGQRYGINVTVGSLAGALSGLHQDQVTVTLTAR